jgi:protein SCO1/2
MWVGGVLVGAVAAFAVFQPIKVLPRIRVAPGFALLDQHGDAHTSETGRGVVTLYSFLPLDCDDPACAETLDTLAEIARRVPAEADLGDTDFRIVTIALADGPAPAELARAATVAGADGEDWVWIGGSLDRVRAAVGAGFRQYFDIDERGEVTFDRGYVLVDGDGVVRGEYRYRTISDDADKIVGQVDSLGVEIRYSSGAAGLAYEAAHLFSCYG